ncbi:MAG: hypothetical protein KAY32_10740 [Candidatus Eisenbacteria sp.]|nr:hypothetical protein [Candidatus Eisenbacteria bacterium]
MRVLAILYCFPPLQVPAALVYLKLVLGLRSNGVDVEILAIDPRSFLAPAPDLIDPSIMRVVPEDLTQHLVWSPEAMKPVRVIKRLLSGTPWGLRWFEPKKREWTFAARRYLRGLDLRRYDLLLTCSQPHANHLLGPPVKKMSGLPWIAYFSDPWGRNPYAPARNRRSADHHRRLEAQVLEAADYVLYTSDEMLRLTAEDHGAILGGKSGVLPHAFVPDWYAPGRLVPEGFASEMQASGREARAAGRPLRLLHTGHFYGPRTPAPLIQALAGLGRVKDLEGRLEIDCYGSFPEEARREVSAAGLERVLRVHPVIPYLDSLALMSEYDLLLLIDAKLTRTQESVFLPSKLIDYLGSGTPVLGVSPRRGSTARVLSETGGLFCDIEDSESLTKMLTRLLAGESPPRPDPVAVRAYHYGEVARRLLATAATLGVPAGGVAGKAD